MSTFLGTFSPVLLSFGGLLLVGWIYRHHKRDWLVDLGLVATTLRIDLVPTMWNSRGVAAGEVRGCSVEIKVWESSPTSVRTRIRVDAGLPSNLAIKAQDMTTQLAQFARGKDTQTGLETFDDTFFLDGIPEAELLSLLSARSRSAIWNCIGENNIDGYGTKPGCCVKKGELQLDWGGRMSIAEILEAVSAMLDLGEALKEFSSTAEGLLHHAFEDPEPAFRLRCFSALLEHRASTPEAQEALQRGAASEDPAFLFVIERHKPEPNLDVIAALVRGGDLPDSLKTSGLHMLDSRHAGELSIEAEGGTAGGLSVQPSGEGGLSPAEEPVRRPRGQKLKS